MIERPAGDTHHAEIADSPAAGNPGADNGRVQTGPTSGAGGRPGTVAGGLPPDAVLLSHARDGDGDAFRSLRRRHESTVRRAACALGPDPDALVDATFDLVRDEVAAGGGPTRSMQPHLITALRATAAERLLPGGGTVVGDLAAARVGRAYARLPEIDAAVLWYVRVEGTGAPDTAGILGLSPRALPDLLDGAVQRLGEEYLRADSPGGGRDRYRPRLAGYVAGTLGRPTARAVAAHLPGCAGCRDVVMRLRRLDDTFRAWAGPLVGGRCPEPVALARPGAASRLATNAARAADRLTHRTGRFGPMPARGLAALVFAGAVAVTGVGAAGVGVGAIVTHNGGGDGGTPGGVEPGAGRTPAAGSGGNTTPAAADSPVAPRSDRRTAPAAVGSGAVVAPRSGARTVPSPAPPVITPAPSPGPAGSPTPAPSGGLGGAANGGVTPAPGTPAPTSAVTTPPATPDGTATG